MKLIKSTTAGMALLAGALMLTNTASAATVGAGTFNLTGTAVGSTQGVTFYLNSVGDQASIALNPLMGVFASTGTNPLTVGSMQTIKALTTANGVTPPTFDLVNFITLTDGINLDAMGFSVPAGTTPCTSASTGPCLVNAASPVVLLQGADGVSATFSLYGEAHFAGQTTYTPFTAIFSSPSTNYATISAFEAAYTANGGIPAVSYSASFTLAPVPEPASLAFVALGLIGCGFYRRGRKTVA